MENSEAPTQKKVERQMASNPRSLHTPGPWHAGREHISDDIGIRQHDKRGRAIAVVPMQVKCDDLESCANARVIALAPEYHQAAGALVRAITQCADSTEGDQPTVPLLIGLAIIRLKELHAKAEGAPSVEQEGNKVR